MTATHNAGPQIIFGGSNNPDRAPSAFDRGIGIADPRSPFRYDPGDRNMTIWASPPTVCVINQVPAALLANNIVTSQVAVSGTPLTLTAGTGVTASSSVRNALTGATVTGLLAIDTAMTQISFGNTGVIKGWDPTKGISRCIRIVSAGNDSGGTFTVAGYDLYGYPLTATVTGANVGTATTLKAFKYISAVTPGGTMSGNTVTVGTTDTIGLPLRADFFGEVEIVWNNAGVTANTGFVAAVTTDPSTALTGDVRGTYALQSAASNGTLRLTVKVIPSVANVVSATGLFGVAQT